MAKSKTNPQSRKPVWQLSRRGVYGSLAVVLAACAWTFFLGVLVGRGTAPVHFDIEKLGHDLKALREQVQQHRARELETYSAAIENKSDLDFYEDLKQPGSDPAAELDLSRRTPQPTIVADDPAQAEEGSAETAAIPIKTPMPGLKPKRGAAVQPSKAPKSAAPPAKAAAPAAGSLTLQVASLRDAEVADAMAARLRQKGYAVSRSGVTLPGKGIWYRVQVGRFTDRESAAATMRALEAMGLNPILVSR